MKRLLICTTIVLFLATASFSQTNSTSKDMVRLVTLDPGHFHAALVQKSMYKNVDPEVHVYAPAGPDVKWHLERIDAYNSRKDEPTKWKEEVYTGNDFFEKMLADKAGNVVVLAGNNQKKTEYIAKSINAGLNVLGDKPMVINSQEFEKLKGAFETAAKKNLLLYDIMTERFEITTIIQKELSMMPEVFGTLQKGTPDNPAVQKESVHYFYKYVSGNVLTRPTWFMDVDQAGEGIVDVTTHLVDLVQWECFPGQSVDYTKDIQLTSAKRWTTDMTRSEFTQITKVDDFPDFLKKDVVNDSILKVYCNGEINYKIKGINAKVTVKWGYKAADGAGDSHFSILRGTKANVVIRQGEEQNYIPSLYVEPANNDAAFEKTLREQIRKIQVKYPGVDLKKSTAGWEVTIPEKYREGHEAHFARVTRQFLEYLQNRNMPKWEVPNMLAKYYITTKALELAKQKK